MIGMAGDVREIAVNEAQAARMVKASATRINVFIVPRVLSTSGEGDRPEALANSS
jgi:hypothetical protein